MPLRIWSYLGVVIAVFALLYAVCVIVRTTIFGSRRPRLCLADGRDPVPRRAPAASRSACSANMSAGSWSRPSSRPLYVVREDRHRRGRRLMERDVFDRMAELDQPIGGSSRAASILADLIARDRPAAGERADPRDRLRHRPQFRDARRASAGSTRASSMPTARALASKRLGRAVDDAPLPELTGVPDRHLRPDRLARRARACRRRPRRARRASRTKLDARRQAAGHRAGQSVDVERARRRPPPPAPLLARASFAQRRRDAGLRDRPAVAVSTACSSR